MMGNGVDSPYADCIRSREKKMQRQPVGRAAAWGTAILVVTALLGCQRDKTHTVTAADVASAQADAQKEVSDARVEAKKDVKSAAKIAGGDSKDVAVARATGAFDIAMANADGNHKVAIEQCMTLKKEAQQPCKDHADADYQAAAAQAKSMRVTQLEKST
jgi:hypothetical protein